MLLFQWIVSWEWAGLAGVIGTLGFPFFLPNVQNGDPLDTLNSNVDLCFLSKFNNSNDSNVPNPYNEYKINSSYYDNETFTGKVSNSKQPLFLSVNVQSLYSKHENIKTFLSCLKNHNVDVDIVALQETWRLPYLEIVQVPGFKFIHKHRESNRGGGVGFYIKDSISFKLIDELSPFTDNIIESITIEAKIDKKTYLLSSLYRSPTPPKNMTSYNQLNLFFTQFETLLSRVGCRKLNAYIFLDSNINLLNMSDFHAENFLQIVLNTGFIQLITKATRLQNNHASLIDNILTNAPCSKTSSGIIVNDISDHFLTFCQPNYSKIAKPPLPQSKRNFSKDNITQFKNALRNISWNDCLRSNDVDESYSFFWDNFKILYDLHFPKIPIQKNKNKNKIKNFLTKGLLISRNTKN